MLKKYLGVKSPAKTIGIGVGHGINIHHTAPENTSNIFATVYEDGNKTDMSPEQYSEWLHNKRIKEEHEKKAANFNRNKNRAIKILKVAAGALILLLWWRIYF